MTQLRKVYVPADDIIAAYKGGLSFNAVGRELGVSATHVKDTMRRHAPDSIRSLIQQVKVRAAPVEIGFTLTALGLCRVGPCQDCGVEIVSETRERGQRCGFCATGMSFKAPRRAA